MSSGFRDNIVGFVKRGLGIIGIDIRQIDGGRALPLDSLYRDAMLSQKQLIRSDSDIVIFDLGAHDGYSATQYLDLFSCAQIFCFEPFEESFAKLAQRFQNNERVQLFDCAVSEEEGDTQMYISEVSSVNSLLDRPQVKTKYYPGPPYSDQVNVEVSTVDRLIARLDIRHIHILKMDIEGSELLALKGARKALSESAIDVIYLEVSFAPRWENGPLFHNIGTYLDEFNYSLFNLYMIKHASNGQVRRADAIFISERLRKEVEEA